MHTLRTRTRLVWLGILLVLMPLIAPTVSHALSRQATLWGADAVLALSMLESSVCRVDATTVRDPDSPGQPARHAQAACDYCSLHMGLGIGAAAPTEMGPLPAEGRAAEIESSSYREGRRTAHGRPPESSSEPSLPQRA